MMMVGQIKLESGIKEQSPIYMQLRPGTIRIASVDHLLPGQRRTDISPKADSDTMDEALENVIQALQKDKEQIWNSIEIFNEYQAQGGVLLTRDVIMSKLTKHFGDEIILFSSPGYANIITFRKQAAHQLKIVKDCDGNNISTSISTLAKQIKDECKGLVLTKNSFEHRCTNHKTLCRILYSIC